MYDEKDKMVLCGTSSWVLNVTCADTTLDGAVSMLYDTYMPTLKLKNAMYRSDLGKSAKKRIKALREGGVL
jgi:phosphoribosylamine-glycine ligase